jgi:hypothetical protein
MSTKQSSQQRLTSSETGIVAVMVTLIMMLVISLIVLGFAQVSRRTQRNALDTQLSTQAYYAAESGVNDAITVMRTLPVGPLPKKDKCIDSGPYQFDSQSLSTLGTGVSYSCVLIDPSPSTIFYSLGENASQAIRLKAEGGVNFKTLTFSWVPPDDIKTQPLANCPNGASQYRKAVGATGGWDCKYAALHTELVPTNTLNRASLMNTTNVNYLDPVSVLSPGTSNWSADNGKSIAARCVDVPAPKCTATVNFNGAGLNAYYLRLGALYRSAAVSITATDTGNAPIRFAETQAHIDVTGKAQDVLRRVLVAVKLNGSPSSTPVAAITSGDSICKRFSVTGGSFNVEDFNAKGEEGNPLCEVQSVGTVLSAAVGGAADFTACDINTCGGAGGTQPTVSWYGKFMNTSDNNPADVVGCIWNFDDAKYGGTSSTATTSCQFGDTITHLFTPNTYPGPYTTCRWYTISLKVLLADGTVKTKTQPPIKMPGGSLVTCLTFV